MTESTQRIQKYVHELAVVSELRPRKPSNGDEPTSTLTIFEVRNRRNKARNEELKRKRLRTDEERKKENAIRDHLVRENKRVHVKLQSLEEWAASALKRLKNRAKARGLEFNLTVEDLIPGPVCPVYGTQWVFGSRGRGYKNPYGPSVDRIDSSKGYVKGNVCVISNRANLLKSNGNAEEHRLIAQYIELMST